MAIKTHAIHFLSVLCPCVLLFSISQFYAEEEKAIQPMQLSICFAENKSATMRNMYYISEDFFNITKKDETTIRQDEFDSAKVFVSFLNISNEDTRIFSEFLKEPIIALGALLRTEDGQRVRTYLSGREITYRSRELAYTEIRANESHGWVFMLKDFMEPLPPGKYTIRFKYHNQYGVDCFKGAIYSNDLSFTVVENNEEANTSDAPEGELIPAQAEELLSESSNADEAKLSAD